MEQSPTSSHTCEAFSSSTKRILHPLLYRKRKPYPMDKIEAILPEYVDSTMISCFRSCQTKFRREFILALRPVALSVDLHAGGCFASALETFYDSLHVGGKTVEQSLLVAYRRYLAEWGDFVPYKDTPKTKDRVWEAFADPQEGYLAAYPPLTDKVH